MHDQIIQDENSFRKFLASCVDKQIIEPERKEKKTKKEVAKVERIATAEELKRLGFKVKRK